MPLLQLLFFSLTHIIIVKPHEALPFWGSRHTTYPRLAPLAEDLIAAPVSQAYILREFSLFVVNYLLEREIVLGVV